MEEDLLNVGGERPHEDSTCRIHGGKKSVALADVGGDDLVVMVEDRVCRVILVAGLLEVPDLNALVEGGRYKLSIIEQDARNQVVVRLESIDARARLEAEDHDVEVLRGQGERVLPAQLTRVAEAGLRDKELLLGDGFVVCRVQLDHANKAII